MITVNQILKGKQGKVITVKPEDTLYKALKVLADNNIGALVVFEGEKVAGIFFRNGVLSGMQFLIKSC
ncbi:MAG: CBS domain-containing protein [Candidatus Scalindua sp.]|nr:CBS domain-containing protein [Candidatus Scalindua sp.]